ncbi:amidohydrolase family protein [Brevibacterium sp. GP-SGM9]|uniref:amidohydrolase family protein n=1 Tax=unclassified Brevibacterium TaxID=2614124 RepID=UPI001E2FB1BC|nr:MULTISPECIES: amidohydrolase family protein [unclassified Brevibacterium]MCD1284326.1 4-oxalomesaconate hydratase [Brevibacterium sp. CCUG 69071]MDK8436062.1 amidohydrolase family protein [Brevibacterium sp. H-BE7]
MIIDCHGHYTTAPSPLGDWRDDQIASLDNGPMPHASGPEISDDEIRESLEGNQLKLMDERGIDLTVFSPRASFMAHHLGDFSASSAWARICNDLCSRVSRLYPDRFAPAIMLPQSPGADPASCIEEIDRCVNEHDVVALNINPDPSGGHWTSPPLTDESWFPIYEKMIEHGLPGMVHVSTSVNPAFHTTGAHYLNADTTAVMQLIEGDLFGRYPELRLVIPHGGGAAPYHWGRFRGLAQALGRPDLEQHILGNVYFDTCVYHQPGIDELLSVIPIKNILFASEMIGAVRTVDPTTGFNFDDTVRYIDNADLDKEERADIFEHNARRVYPRLEARIASYSRRTSTQHV